MSVTYIRDPSTGEFKQVGPGGATTDTTLSQVGKPADAAAVGAALSNYATEAYVNSELNSKTVTEEEIVSALGFTPQSNTAIIPKTRGGAGRDISDFPANAIIRNSGSGGNDLYYTATLNGACYATEANGYPKFGTLPIAQGGTGKTTHTLNSVLTGNGTSAVNNVATASGALYATSANGAPVFGTLPVAQGGTGQTKAWTNGTVSSLNSTTVSSAQFAIFPYLNKAFIRLNILTPSAIAADGALFVALPSTIPTAHTALACYNEIGYDIHAGVSSVEDKGVYIMNSGTSSMPKGTRLYIAGWYSI